MTFFTYVFNFLIFGSSEREFLSNQELIGTIPPEEYLLAATVLGTEIGQSVGNLVIQNLETVYKSEGFSYVYTKEGAELVYQICKKIGCVVGSEMPKYILAEHVGIRNVLMAGPGFGTVVGQSIAESLHNSTNLLFHLHLDPGSSEEFFKRLFGSAGNTIGRQISESLTSRESTKMASILYHSVQIKGESSVSFTFFDGITYYCANFNEGVTYIVAPYVGSYFGGFVGPTLLGAGTVIVAVSIMYCCSVYFWPVGVNSISAEKVTSLSIEKKVEEVSTINLSLPKIVGEGVSLDVDVALSLSTKMETYTTLCYNFIVQKMPSVTLFFEVEGSFLLIFFSIFKVFILIALANMLIALTIKIKL